MSRDDDGAAVRGQRAEDARQSIVVDGSDTTIRLIGQKALGLPDEHGREFCPTEFATGQLVQAPVEHVRDVREGCRCFNRPTPIAVEVEVQLLPQCERRR